MGCEQLGLSRTTATVLVRLGIPLDQLTDVLDGRRELGFDELYALAAMVGAHPVRVVEEACAPGLLAAL